MIFTDDDRVTVTDPKDRWYGEHGTVTDWYHGMTKERMYLVRLDHLDDSIPFTEAQLTLGENLYVRSE